MEGGYISKWVLMSVHPSNRKMLLPLESLLLLGKSGGISLNRITTLYLQSQQCSVQSRVEPVVWWLTLLQEALVIGDTVKEALTSRCSDTGRR